MASDTLDRVAVRCCNADGARLGGRDSRRLTLPDRPDLDGEAMDQFERVETIARLLRAFSSHARATGTPSNDGSIQIPRSALTRLAKAAEMAGECLVLGGVMREGGEMVDRPSYCFPDDWKDAMLVTLALWISAGGAEPAGPSGRVQSDVLERAAAVADTLESSMLVVPATINGELTTIALPMTNTVCLAAMDAGGGKAGQANDGTKAAKLPKTRRGFQRLAETTTKDQPIIAALKEGKSYRQVAAECKVGKSTVERVAKSYGLTGHAPETVPLDGTLQKNLRIRGKPGKRGGR